ncbi:hypothetical protein XPA_007347 [Xanthoria parietina]
MSGHGRKEMPPLLLALRVFCLPFVGSSSMASISGLGIMSPNGEESGYFLSLLALPQGIGYRIKEPKPASHHRL